MTSITDEDIFLNYHLVILVYVQNKSIVVEAVSATDGMSVGVPYLFSNDDYYHELANNCGVYYDDYNFLSKINELLNKF